MTSELPTGTTDACLQSAQWHVATKIGRPCPASVSFLHEHVTDHSDITSVAVAWTVVNPELGA